MELPESLPGAPESAVVIDEPVRNLVELRTALRRRLPETEEHLDEQLFNLAVNDEMVLSGEDRVALRDGDRVTVVPIIAGG